MNGVDVRAERDCAWLGLHSDANAGKWNAQRPSVDQKDGYLRTGRDDLAWLANGTQKSVGESHFRVGQGEIRWAMGRQIEGSVGVEEFTEGERKWEAQELGAQDIDTYCSKTTWAHYRGR